MNDPIPAAPCELLHIHKNCQPPGRLRSIAVIRVGREVHAVPVRVGIMRSFASFSRHVLLSIGLLITFTGAEWWPAVVRAAGGAG